MCIICTSGSADFPVEFNTVHVGQESLLFIYPGQLHRVVANRQLGGWLLLFDPKLVLDQLQVTFEQSLHDHPMVTLKKEDMACFI